MRALKPLDDHKNQNAGWTSEAVQTQHVLPIGKLRGVAPRVRATLKVRRITTCGQLLSAAAIADRRDELVRATGLDPDAILALVQRADMARVNGVGAMFGLMLEELDIKDVQTLASQETEQLHAALRDYNRRERIARRSPTPEEVADWVAQARALVPLVTYPARRPGSRPGNPGGPDPREASLRR
jgi:predicted flap endonuclease-1-like 5' DNA nuclease